MAENAVKTARPYSSRRSEPPLLNHCIFAPYKIATVIDTVAEYGIAPDIVLARTGLSLLQVRDPHTLTSIRQYITACDNIIRAGADFDIAYTIGSRLHLSAYGMYGYALMCSPTMRDFFDFAVKYHPLATPTLQLVWRLEGNVAIWEFREIFGDVMSNDAREFLIRQYMKQTYTHVREVAGPDNLPIRALFAVPSNDVENDERQLGCPCTFNQISHELHYPISILTQSPELGNRLTRAMLEETCDRLIGQAKMSSGLAGQVYQMVLLAPNRFPSMLAIAQQLGFTERTLRRRLAEEGTSYGDIIDDVRKSLALEYLQTTRLSADDVAWKVGFSDSANLRRAIKRWTGLTINELRQQG